MGFERRDGELYCDGLPVREVAEEFGTPLYVYSASTMTKRFAEIRAEFGDDAVVCFAVKSNSARAILKHFASLGSGFDVVSGGELARLQAADIDCSQVVFAGVGKQDDEIEAAARAGILLFNVESPFELDVLEDVGRRLGRPLHVAVRLNPDVAGGTHAYINTASKENKFGIDLTSAADVVSRIAASDHLALRGYHVHLGSQLRSPEPWLAAFDKVAAFMDGAPERSDGVEFYDLGGGFGIPDGEGAERMELGVLAGPLLERLRARGLRPIVEPGRYLIGEAGVLVTRVLGTKGHDKRFLIVDGAMNDLIRPALYQAVHGIEPLTIVPDAPVATYDVVGPVCESGDFLGQKRELPAFQRGDLLAVLGAGAYGASMASNYNSRARPAEVVVERGSARLIRRRETLQDLLTTEL